MCRKNNIKAIISIIFVISLIFIIIVPKKVNANTVEYTGDETGVVTTLGDFFVSFGELMPGDVKEGKALIKNKTKDKVEVFFRTEKLTYGQDYDEIDTSLLQKIKLKIKLKRDGTEEKLLYNGDLGAESLNKYISLGIYEKGYDGEFIFTIEVPKELKNAYALSKIDVKWIFAVEKEGNKPQDKPSQDDPSKDDTNNNKETQDNQNPNNSNQSDSNKDNPNKSNASSNQGNIKTGDYIYYIIIILSVIVIINIIINIKTIISIKIHN